MLAKRLHADRTALLELVANPAFRRLCEVCREEIAALAYELSHLPDLSEQERALKMGRLLALEEVSQAAEQALTITKEE